ncbi:ATP-binding cassette domain-containing protein [Mycoplasmopsis cynos]|uniref:ATP-binding cassette domain-containing protein n=1 Tax=Mycoplasmopsis cynos TaxID=171284 RepID=UPI003969D1A5
MKKLKGGNLKKENAIEFLNISKYFGAIKANQNISFEVQKGTIHALIGENGAGKSTLMSILFGLYEPDDGVIKINDKEVVIKGPNDANHLGIGMVHQHFKLVDVYTNLENIVLGSEEYDKTTRVINYGPAIKKIKTIQNKFNLHFDLNKKTGTETVATQQKVEIMKMLYRDSDILIFDEPTAVLTDQEITGLLETFKTFKKQGKTILFISHKLAEIKEVADNATVLRHGVVTGNFVVKDVSIHEMANKMVGGDVENARNTYSDTSRNQVILDIQNVSTSGSKPLKNVSLQIKSGEILAIAGVEGNGQTDLEYVLSGMKKPTSGSIKLTKTDLIREKITKINKENKTKTIAKSICSILLFIIATTLMVLNPNAPDINAIYKIMGAFLYFGFLILGTNIISNQFKVRHNLDNTLLEGTSSKTKQLFLMIKVYTISILMLIIILNVVGLITNNITIITPIMMFLMIINSVLVGWFLVFIYVSIKKVKLLSKCNLIIHIIFSTLVTSFYAAAFILSSILGLATRFGLAQLFDYTIFYVIILCLLLAILTFLIWYFIINEKKFKFDNESNKNHIELENLSVYEISKLGFSFIPSDRHKHGLILDYNIKYNTVIRRLWDTRYVKFGIFRDKNIQKDNEKIIQLYDVRGARNGYSQSRQLSGGNQQKFIVGREMNSPHDFILIVQPTRGLDVGAIHNIHEQILKEKQNGKAILLISYELDEVLALADKIAVINTGEILTVKDAKDLTRTEIGVYMAHKNKNEKGGK